MKTSNKSALAAIGGFFGWAFCAVLMGFVPQEPIVFLMLGYFGISFAIMLSVAAMLSELQREREKDNE